MEDLKDATDTKLKEMKQFNEGLMELETNRNKSESRISFLERQLGEGQERVLRVARHSNTGLAVPAEWVERAGRLLGGGALARIPITPAPPTVSPQPQSAAGVGGEDRVMLAVTVLGSSLFLLLLVLLGLATLLLRGRSTELG